MTPAERARQIDMEEFKAECAIARERALAYAKQCRQIEQDKLTDWFGGTRCALSTTSEDPANRGAYLYTAHGQTHTMSQWAEVLGVLRNTLEQRINRGYSPEEALSPNFKRRPYGVSPNPAGRKAKQYKLNGQHKTLSQWAHHYGFEPHTIAERVRKGMTLEAALTVPLNQHRGKRRPVTSPNQSPSCAKTCRGGALRVS